MDSTDMGIRVGFRHGVVIAMAVQTWNLAIWLDRCARADRAIRTIQNHSEAMTTVTGADGPDHCPETGPTDVAGFSGEDRG